MAWDSTIDTIHSDDFRDIGPSKYHRVVMKTIDWDAVERRADADIQRNIARRTETCACGIPFNVPCPECGAGT